MADINIQEITNHINIETANGYNLEFNGPVVNMNVSLSNYYTKTETDALLNEKADKANTYTISQINDMVQDINTAVDTKQNLITGAASTITNSNLTTNRAVISNASGKLAVSNVTSTELGYLSGVTSDIQTQLNAKASTALDNLSSAGQMIIDSANGTISNCILEIPQNIKLELSNGILTVKQGSVLVMSGSSTYTTITVNADKTKDFLSYPDGDIVVFANSVGGLIADGLLNKVGSGNELPSDNSTFIWFYLITDYSIYHQENNVWVKKKATYPLCILNKSGNTVTFVKDSNGNDMIFNGAGFIGHHVFVYPGVKALAANGFNGDGSLASTSITNKALRIVEISSTTPASGYEKILQMGSAGVYNANNYKEVESYNDLGTKNYSIQYVKKDNIIYYLNGATYETRGIIKILSYIYNGTTVTDFTIRQPVRTATVEMLDNALGDVETLLAAI